MRSTCAVLFAWLVMTSGPASAWTRPGHMVTAQVAWEEIATRPALVASIGELLRAHPDRGAFQVAVDRTTGTEQVRRLFLECARWPDDARGTLFDQPSWHVALSAVSPTDPSDGVRGQAVEALLLAERTLANKTAEPSERSKALCWLLHIVGDLHQPLHAAEFTSDAYPQGDAAGGKRFVRDPLAGDPTSLHWLWDDSVLRSGAHADVDKRARELQRGWPRQRLQELQPWRTTAELVSSIRRESIELARGLAFRPDLEASMQPEEAVALSPQYWADVQTAAERRVATAGYRIADLVVAALVPE